MSNKSTIDTDEVAKFAQHASQWWNPDGPLKTLHDINPLRLDYIQQHTSLRGKTVLDIGCGGGLLCEGMAVAGAQVTGLDVETEAIETATRHAEASGLNITYVCQPLERYLPDQSGVFDEITCFEMLEHVCDPRLVIHHAARLLKPGGLLFLSTINRTWKAYMAVVVAAEYLLNLLPRQTHDYAKFIKPSELAAMLRAESMDEEALVGMDYNPLTRQSLLTSSVSVNFILVGRKRLT